ncbi:hypothetical protein QOT17_013613 [Balamuthia mandrillaris]
MMMDIHWRSWLVLVLLFCWWTLCFHADGQTCEPWDKIPSFCAQFEEWQGSDVHIYVPKNASLAALEESVAYAINLVGALGYDGSLASRCNHMWVRLNCATHLRPCARVKTANAYIAEALVQLEAPVQPCKSTCLEYVNACTEYVESFGLHVGGSLYFPPGFEAPLTCLENDTNGEPLYQTAHYAVQSTAAKRAFEVQCNELPANGTFLVCEPPLTTVEGTNDCAFVCPLPAYKEDQYDAVKTLQLVFGWLSWVGSMIVILSYSLHSKLRRFPSNLIRMTAIAAHLESVGMILPTFFGYNNTWCGFDTQYLMPDSRIANQQLSLSFRIESLLVHSPLCTFQGWLIQFGFLSSTMWWGIVALNICLKVYFSKLMPKKKVWSVGLQVIFHVCGWVVPAFLMLIPAARDEINFAPGGTFCSLSSADAFFLAFWAIPVGIILLVGTLLFVSSLVRLLWFARQLNKLRKTCETYFRVILFVLVYLSLISFIFAYSLRVVTAKDTIEDGYSNYYQCLITIKKKDCSLPAQVHNYPLAVLRSIGYSSLGLLLFLTFCITPSMGRFWWCFFRHIIQARFSLLLPSDENTPNKSGNPDGSKKSDKSTIAGMLDIITMSMDLENDDEEGEKEENIP